MEGRLVRWLNMNALFVVMFMIPKLGTWKMISSQVSNLKICRMIGFAPYAVQTNQSLLLKMINELSFWLKQKAGKSPLFYLRYYSIYKVKICR